jgi:phosphoribosyl 1,2-cyclic phosphodiesterase
VAVHFQSLRSSSAGNCLAVWTRTSSLLIDCGVKTQCECRQVLEEHAGRAGHLDAVIVSHAHGDHMSYGALRVLGCEGVRILGDARVLRQLRDRHQPEDWKAPPAMQAMPGVVDIGDFRVRRFEVPHAPQVPSFGFAITARVGEKERSFVVCTDFNDFGEVLPHFLDTDFVFVEANHDLELLRRHPNPASRYHLNNVKSASLLCHVVRRSATPPRAVMLGHLSEERNRRALAIGEVTRMFQRTGTGLRFHLEAAPASRPSEVVEF